MKPDAIASLIEAIETDILSMKVTERDLEKELDELRAEIAAADETRGYLQRMQQRLVDTQNDVHPSQGGEPQYPMKGTWRDKIFFVIAHKLKRFSTNEDIMEIIEDFEPRLRRESVVEAISRLTGDTELVRYGFQGLDNKPVKATGLRSWVSNVGGARVVKEGHEPNFRLDVDSIKDEDLPF